MAPIQTNENCSPCSYTKSFSGICVYMFYKTSMDPKLIIIRVLIKLFLQFLMSCQQFYRCLFYDGGPCGKYFLYHRGIFCCNTASEHHAKLEVWHHSLGPGHCAHNIFFIFHGFFFFCFCCLLFFAFGHISGTNRIGVRIRTDIILPTDICSLIWQVKCVCKHRTDSVLDKYVYCCTPTSNWSWLAVFCLSSFFQILHFP